MRHGLVEKAVNNTLDIYDRYFNDLEVEEKVRRATVGRSIAEN